MNVCDRVIVIMRMRDDRGIHDSTYENQVDTFAFYLEYYIALYIFLK